MKYLIYCRSGFEKECADEVAKKFAKMEIFGHPLYKIDNGFVEYIMYDPEFCNLEIDYRDFIFARQIIFVFSHLKELPEKDRVTPISEEVISFFNKKSMPLEYKDIFIEFSDTNEGKKLKDFSKKFLSPFSRGIKKGNFSRVETSRYIIHLFFESYSVVQIAISNQGHSSKWPLGIPRLKFPKDAPSRSTLKLDEAFYFFLKERFIDDLLEEGMTACDLGAAPGGWSYQMVHKGIFVSAVDKAKMDHTLMETEFIEHIKEDAFKFKPRKNYNWLLCDMVESPLKVTKLISLWFKNKWCENAIVNLKLPMNKRTEEINKCVEYLEKQFGESLTINLKQLYHDRKEVTLFLSVIY